MKIEDYPKGARIVPVTLGDDVAQMVPTEYMTEDGQILMPLRDFYEILRTAAMQGHLNGLSDAFDRMTESVA